MIIVPILAIAAAAFLVLAAMDRVPRRTPPSWQGPDPVPFDDYLADQPVEVLAPVEVQRRLGSMSRSWYL